MKKDKINIFYATDDRFVRYTVVSLKSLIENANKKREYVIHILNAGLTNENVALLKELEQPQFEIAFSDVRENLASFSSLLPIRDYYTKTTYYRFFISEMFPEYNKAIYIDSDTIVLGDISKLFDTNIDGFFVGACHEQVMIQEPIYGKYVESVLGISRASYFNAGVLLMNLDMFREHQVIKEFARLLSVYTFVVTQDEDYLNLILKDKIFWLDQSWNSETFKEIPVKEKDMKIIHYVMVNKPWHYSDSVLGDYFWKYAKDTTVYSLIKEELDNYSDEKKANDIRCGLNLAETAKKEIQREDSYFKVKSKGLSDDRLDILWKINEYEFEGKFDKDVEEDPPSRTLMPNEIDYLRRSFKDKTKASFAFMCAHVFMDYLLFKKKMIIKDILGEENFQALNSGAIITCNHFNAYDSFAIQLAYDGANQRKRKFYRVIREGNYTSFPGFYGFIMRNCNTLPLSSNLETLKKFIKGTDELLKKGNFVLFYPEQSMWWNYRKPKPLKPGAYKFAARNNVPVLPCFITMQDSDQIGEDGFPVQEYTIHIEKAIYPKPELDIHENEDYMMAENYRVWKDIYENNYKEPLHYLSSVKVEA